MRIAVEGCCHGELDKIYETLQYAEKVNNFKVDLLLICGDFQAVRNRHDMKSMAVPAKYQQLNTFHKYYSGEMVAPVLTVFIGGNHEASNYMQELPYGGWVAKNIYYMGYASVIQVGGVRIGGLSGIFKGKDFNKGHHERPPYTEDSKRSVYHIRNLEVFRLKQLTRHVDIFLSHDWPRGIAKHGNVHVLVKKKPFLREEVENESLGSGPTAEILHKLKPSYWFSAHLHVKYSACVQHSASQCTKFLSLDKCLPGRDFLQVLDIPSKEEGPVKLKLDPEWLHILRSTNHLLSLQNTTSYMPGPGSAGERYSFEAMDEDLKTVQNLFGGNLTFPENFETTAPTLHDSSRGPPEQLIYVNPQTSLLCDMLEITHPNAVFTNTTTSNIGSAEINLDAASDDTDDVADDEDEMPSEINSSLDVSCVSSGMEISFVDSSFNASLSDSFSTSKDTSLAGNKMPQVEVADDDEELQAILSQQKSQKSDSGTMLCESGKQDSEVSSTSSPKTQVSEGEGDEFAMIIAAQRKKEGGMSDSDKSGSVSFSGGSASQNKSSSELEYSSLDSQDEAEQSSSLARKVDSLGVDDSCTSSAQNGSSGAKRSSPNSTHSPCTTKKLKRRNVSMYSSSGTEEDCC